jgi:DNA-binding protein H-NS
MRMNLDDMSLDELKKLHRDVEKAIASFEARRIAEARKAMEKVAREMGVTLDEIVGPAAAKKTKSTAPAKYRHPENAELTWTGRGRRPDWFTAALAAGKSPDDLLIA